MAISIHSVKFDPVSNRNEKRIQEILYTYFEEELNNHWLEKFTSKDIQDIYALTLNQLPSRYVQPGTIVVNDPIAHDAILNAIEFSLDIVSRKPKP